METDVMPRPDDRKQSRKTSPQSGAVESRRRPPSDERRVRDIMREVTELAHPDHDLHEARDRFDEAGASVLPVVDGEEVVGVLTRDAVLDRLGKEAPRGGADDDDGSPEAHVADIMVANLPICRPEESADDVAAVIEREARPGLLVVGENDELIGIVLREDLAREGAVFSHAPALREAPEATAHALKSASRAPAGRPGQPKSYAVKPRIRR
jgi:CBS domain-containing protein